MNLTQHTKSYTPLYTTHTHTHTHKHTYTHTNTDTNTQTKYSCSLLYPLPIMEGKPCRPNILVYPTTTTTLEINGAK